MRIDISPGEAWIATNERYRKALGPTFADEGLQIQTYAGYAHALREAGSGLAKLFSHKKTVAFIGPHLEPAMDAVAIAFSEESYTVKVVTPGEDLTPLLADLIFVMYAVDDPVTGRTYDTSAIDAALKDKRVFRIALSHARHRFEVASRPAPFEVRVMSLDPSTALIVAGERFRAIPSLAPLLPWPADKQVEFATGLAQEADIKAFEFALPNGFKAYFGDSDARLWDRAAIYADDLDGSAVAELLAERLGAPLGAAGAEGALESTSACRWSNPKFTDWLLARGEKPEVVRGILLIGAGLVTSRLTPALMEVADEIRRMQRG